jgi:transposase
MFINKIWKCFGKCKNIIVVQEQNYYNIFLQVKENDKDDLRIIFDALFYGLKISCNWRMLTDNYPKWELKHYYSSKWRDEELFSYLKIGKRKSTKKVIRKPNVEQQ